MIQLFWVNFFHYLKRLSRDYFGLTIFTVLPVGLVFILSSVVNKNPEGDVYVNGYNMVTTFLATGMMIMFQLNSGLYILNCLNNDLAKAMKWRLKASPAPLNIMILAGTTACLVFSILQGVLIIIFTKLFMAAYWGNIWITLLVLILTSLISQFINIILFLLIRNLSIAEYLSWFISWSMATLGGLMFPLPENKFFNVTKQYATPYALAQNIIKESGFLGSSSEKLVIYLILLILVTIVLAFIVILLGRRKFQ